ncbi:hypothetical protein FRC0485_02017 [Corynebacterium diphtheriae]|nr:hypothetical protein FRC0485_02017 [Corynebacterium diphtheriae]
MDGETRCRGGGRGEQFLRLNDVSQGAVLRKCKLRVHKLLTLGHQAPSPARYLL